MIEKSSLQNILKNMKCVEVCKDVLEIQDKEFLNKRIRWLCILDNFVNYLEGCRIKLKQILHPNKRVVTKLSHKIPVCLGFENVKRHISTKSVEVMNGKYDEETMMFGRVCITSYTNSSGKFYESHQSGIILCQGINGKNSKQTWNLFAEPENLDGETEFNAIQNHSSNSKVMEEIKNTQSFK